MKSKHIIRKITACWLILLLTASAAWSRSEVLLTSPDGRLEISFKTEELRAANRQGNAPAANRTATLPLPRRLIYEVTFNGNSLMAPSAMGLELEGGRVLGENVAITAHAFSQGRDHYELITGRTAQVDESYNAVTLEVEEQQGARRRFTIEARAYNDAVAFRYHVPEQRPLTEYRLKSEKTEYRLSKDAICYALILPNFRSSYESEFHKLPVSALSNQGGVASSYLVGMPLLINVEGVGWAVITEADIEGNASTYLRNPSGSWTGHWFESVMSPSLREGELPVVSSLPHKTAWRVIMVHDEPTHFMMSNTLTNLNPPSRVEDCSWITTGKSSWDWWNGSLNQAGEKDFSTETMKYYVDFAAESGLEFMTIDAGWSGADLTVCRDNVNVPEVVAYAKEKGVKVFIWVGGTNTWRMMDEAFPVFEEWGVAGLKIDFILRDDQPGIDFYYRVAEKAAKHKLMIDFHGCTKTWGLQRTYPNVVGYECVLGMENSLVGVRDNPENRLMTPFARMIGGLVDYTPGAFENVTREEFKGVSSKPMALGTRAHHLAIYVVYESPYHMVSDWPERYKGDPSFEWIKLVPSSWDRSIAINGYPGEYVTLARKRGDDWYLGAMTNWTPREYDIQLDFLEPGTYEAQIYADTPDSDRFPKKIQIKTTRVKAGNTFKVSMASGGGMAVRFKKVR